MPQSPLWTSVAKIVVVGGVIGMFGMLLASYKGIPVVGLILFGLVLKSHAGEGYSVIITPWAATPTRLGSPVLTPAGCPSS